MTFPAGHGQNRSGYLLSVIWCQFALSFVFVALRFYCRTRITHNVWWDDWCCLFAFVRHSSTNALFQQHLMTVALDLHRHFYIHPLRLCSQRRSRPQLRPRASPYFSFDGAELYLPSLPGHVSRRGKDIRGVFDVQTATTDQVADLAPGFPFNQLSASRVPGHHCILCAMSTYVRALETRNGHVLGSEQNKRLDRCCR